jgi:hypothetical protein
MQPRLMLESRFRITAKPSPLAPFDSRFYWNLDLFPECCLMGPEDTLRSYRSGDVLQGHGFPDCFWNEPAQLKIWVGGAPVLANPSAVGNGRVRIGSFTETIMASKYAIIVAALLAGTSPVLAEGGGAGGAGGGAGGGAAGGAASSGGAGSTSVPAATGAANGNAGTSSSSTNAATQHQESVSTSPSNAPFKNPIGQGVNSATRNNNSQTPAMNNGQGPSNNNGHNASTNSAAPSSAGGTAKGTALGTSANGQPIGTPGSGPGSPENPY